MDGAHGGVGAAVARGIAHRVRGIERARSIAWDPHKMMLLPLQAGMVLVRDERDLDAAFSQRAPYLFHVARRRARVGSGHAQLPVLAPRRRAQGLGRAPALRRRRDRRSSTTTCAS